MDRTDSDPEPDLIKSNRKATDFSVAFLVAYLWVRNPVLHVSTGFLLFYAFAFFALFGLLPDGKTNQQGCAQQADFPANREGSIAINKFDVVLAFG